MNCFPNSVITQKGEFIAHIEANEYFNIVSCETELDIKCKLLEWFSRSTFKTMPNSSKKKNKEFNDFMLNGINKFLHTKFTKNDMENIYTYIGNSCNHVKTICFIASDYNIDILTKK